MAAILALEQLHKAGSDRYARCGERAWALTPTRRTDIRETK